jgi:DNA invertase Pin-like site-specific DNA recombinase
MVKYVGYARVSTAQQGANGLSLDEQSSRIQTVYRSLNQNNPLTMLRDICSAHKKINLLDRHVQTTKVPTVYIISDVSRFCRNKQTGQTKLHNMVSKGHKIFFLRENIIISNASIIELAVPYLEEAELESVRISDRIKQVKQYKRQNGEYLGGRVPFGLEIYVSREGVKKYKYNDNELKIIKFIDICRSPPYTSAALNCALNDILGYVSPDPVVLYEADDITPRAFNTDELSFSEIAAILNDYGVHYRNGATFTAASMRNIRRKDDIDQYIHFPALDAHDVDNLCDEIDQFDMDGVVQAAMPANNGAVPANNGVVPANNGAMPANNGANDQQAEMFRQFMEFQQWIQQNNPQ